MNELHSYLNQIISSANKDQLLDVIYTGSRLTRKNESASDYDFIIVMKGNEGLLDMKEFCKKLHLYSKYPLDLIVTSSEAVFNTNPLLSYSALFNNIRISDLAVTKLPLPEFDPFLLKTSALKILAKNLANNSFKSLRHMKKVFSYFQIAQSDESKIESLIIKSDYDKDYLNLSFGEELQNNNFEISYNAKRMIVSILKSELDILSSQRNWERYKNSESGIDKIFLSVNKKGSSIKDSYINGISSLIEKI